MADLVGQQLGNYRLLRLLGRGAFAAVYLGEHQYLERPAAIKVLHIQMKPDSHESFRREARTIAQLQHPHIIGVHDFGIESQTPYLVMEYTPNGTLRERYPKGTRLPFEQMVTYVKQIASALDYAHERQVIHRDIKPENILLNSKHEVALSDFGVAVLQPTLDSLSTQDPAGTPLYMAPEQIQGKPCAASDQYALGVMVYEWLCGEPPFGGSLFEVFSQHLHESPPSLCARLPQLPAAVEDAVFGALAKDPQRRFATVQDFATALEEACFATQSLSLRGSVEHESPDQIIPPLARATLMPVPSPGEQEHSTDATQPRLKAMQRIERGPEPVQSISSQPTIHSQTLPKPARRSLAQTNRQRLLRRVRSFWITGVFEQSLHGAALLALGLEAQPDAVANPWHLVVHHPETAPQPLPTGTRITQVYDDADGELLILGAPGSGKTTLLLELARDLLGRAEHDEHHPIPVIFNLSSWAMKRTSLVAWMVEELVSKYQVPRKLGQAWIEAEQLLPLLDGLDEVSPKSRTACIEAINRYRQEHGLLPLVVCSRSTDYLTETTRVLLRKAVMVQPLTRQQVDLYLQNAGVRVEALRLALGRDSDLQELATIPLMLNILTLTYQDTPLREIMPLGTLSAKQQQVFATYIKRMLKRQDAQTSDTAQQTIHWLTFLAGRLKQENQTVFSVELLQSSWLTSDWTRGWYHLSCRLFSGLLGGLIVGGVGWLSFLLLYGTRTDPSFGSQFFGLPIGLCIALSCSLVGGFLFGLIFGPTHKKARHLPFRLNYQVALWSWKKLQLRLSKLSEFFRKVAWEDLIAWSGVLFLLLIAGVLIVPFVVLLVILLGLLFGGLSRPQLPELVLRSPNEGTWHSAKNGLLSMLLGTLLGILLGGFFGGPVGILLLGLPGGFFGGFLGGFDAFFSHFLLRFWLWRLHRLPWKLIAFLDKGAEQLLLRKVGGGYIFVHRLLLEYFASLDTAPTPDATRTQKAQILPIKE